MTTMIGGSITRRGVERVVFFISFHTVNSGATNFFYEVKTDVVLTVPLNLKPSTRPRGQPAPSGVKNRETLTLNAHLASARSRLRQCANWETYGLYRI